MKELCYGSVCSGIEQHAMRVGTGGTKGSKGKTIRSYNDQAVRQGKDNVKGYGAYVEQSYEESGQLSA